MINKETVDESQEIPLMNAYFDRETEHIQQVGSLFFNPDYMQIIWYSPTFNSIHIVLFCKFGLVPPIVMPSKKPCCSQCCPCSKLRLYKKHVLEILKCVRCQWQRRTLKSIHPLKRVWVIFELYISSEAWILSFVVVSDKLFCRYHCMMM